MKNFSTWLLVMFMVMFWLFRVVIALTTEFAVDMGGITALNIQMEVILLFVVLLCLILIVKRNIIGALIYLVSYGMYFGVDLFNNIKILMDNGTLSPVTALGAFISLIGIAIPIFVLLDLLLDKNRKAHPVDTKTDWFFKNEAYDRKLDDRADKNNYRTL